MSGTLLVRMVAAVACPTCHESPSSVAFAQVVHNGVTTLQCARCGKVEPLAQWIRPTPGRTIEVVSS